MWWKQKKQPVAPPDPQAHIRFLERCLNSARTYTGIGADEGTAPIALKKDERMLFGVTEGAGLIEPRRTVGHWQGRSQGVSVRVPGTASMRYRLGATKGTFVQGAEEPSIIDVGSFTITTQRAVFVGAKATREWQWSKLIAIQHSADKPWTSIAVSNRQKTSGVMYELEHQELIRFFFDLAVAQFSGTADDLVQHLEAELAEARAATPSTSANAIDESSLR